MWRKISKFWNRISTVRVSIVECNSSHDSCRVTCFNKKCANHNRESLGCNCKNIMIGDHGECRTFMPADGKHGEFPL